MGPRSVDAFVGRIPREHRKQKQRQKQDSENNPAGAFPLETLTMGGPVSVHLRMLWDRCLQVRNFPTPGALCPFKKNPALGHLCSPKHTPTHKYCRRPLWEIRLSLFPKGKWTSLLGMLSVGRGSGLPSFFPFWGPPPSRSNPT